VVATLLSAFPYLWILTDEWTGTFNFQRGNAGANTFYDKQAQALVHGHLWVPTGSLGIEGFVHDGHTYTYFGLFLSILRIPFIELAPGLTGHLTVPSMLVAWLLTALVAPLLTWRVRVLLRGPVALGWAEAVSIGVLLTSILAGSVLLFLAASPRVTDEDIAWTVPITLTTLFLFVGILDRPSWRRVVAAGVLVLAGALERPPPGLACIVGALLIAGWFLIGREGPDRRRWALPMAVVGGLPLLVSAVVDYLKFGTILNGLPLSEQIWTQTNAHRRAFLASTGGKGYSIHFLPTTVWAYLQPLGLRVQPTFPFLVLPITPPHLFGGYIADSLNPTGSAPATMPLLFLLSCWALWVAFRPSAGRGAKVLRIPLITAAGATAVDFLLGYIAPRYLGDFLPFLVLGGAIGLVDLWRRWEQRAAAVRGALVALVVVLGLFSVAANVGIALSPTQKWTSTQAANYVRAVKAVSDVTGHPLDSLVGHGPTLPSFAPADRLFIVGDCAGLYLSSGKRLSTNPSAQAQRKAWLPVEQGPGTDNKLAVTFTSSPSRLAAAVPLVTVGKNSVLLQPAGGGSVRYLLVGGRRPTDGKLIVPRVGKTYHLLVETDLYLRRVTVLMNKSTVLTGPLSGIEAGVTPVVVHTTANTPVPSVTVVHKASPLPDMSLCRSLQSS
jgi:hypothetical protein